MTSEADTRVGLAVWECTEPLAVERYLHQAAAQQSPGPGGLLQTLQTAAGGRAAEASTLSVTSEQEGGAWAWPREAVLLFQDVSNVMEGVKEEEVVAQESVGHDSQVVQVGELGVVGEGQIEVQCVGSEEESHAALWKEKPGPLLLAPRRWSGYSPQSPLELLEALQLQLTVEKARHSSAYYRLRHKIFQSRQPYLERRRNIIQCIPGFWAKAVSLRVTPGLRQPRQAGKARERWKPGRAEGRAWVPQRHILGSVWEDRENPLGI